MNFASVELWSDFVSNVELFYVPNLNVKDTKTNFD